METQIRHHIVQSLIRVCTVYLNPIKRMAGLYGLNKPHTAMYCNFRNFHLNFMKIKPSRIWQNKKLLVFRVTRPYLNLLVKHRIFSGFLEKNIILCILKVKMPFKMLNFFLLFFPGEKKFRKRNVCLPYLKFSDPLPET